MNTAKPFGVARLAPCFGGYFRWKLVIRCSTQEDQLRWVEITRNAYGDQLVKPFTGSIGDDGLYDRNGNPKKYP